MVGRVSAGSRGVAGKDVERAKGTRGQEERECRCRCVAVKGASALQWFPRPAREVLRERSTAHSRLTRCTSLKRVWRRRVALWSYCCGEGGSKDLVNGLHNKRSRHGLIVVEVVVVVGPEREGQKVFMLLAKRPKYSHARAAMQVRGSIAPSVFFGRVDATMST
jgi:hypothetical protein